MNFTTFAIQFINLDNKNDLYNFYITLTKIVENNEEDNVLMWEKGGIFALQIARNILTKGCFVTKLKLERFASEFMNKKTEMYMRKVHCSLSIVGTEKLHRLYHLYYLFTHVNGLIVDVHTYLGLIYLISCIVHLAY